jgi:hypothetical protein
MWPWGWGLEHGWIPQILSIDLLKNGAFESKCKILKIYWQAEPIAFFKTNKFSKIYGKLLCVTRIKEVVQYTQQTIIGTLH